MIIDASSSKKNNLLDEKNSLDIFKPEVQEVFILLIIFYKKLISILSKPNK